VENLIESALLGKIGEAIAKTYGIKMDEITAALPADADPAWREQFEAELSALATRLEASGTAIVERGGQEYTTGVTQHFVTLVRHASDGRIYLLDSLAPGREQSFASGLEALQAMINHVGNGAQDIGILLPPAGTVLPPAQSNSRGTYVPGQGFVPNADAAAETARDVASGSAANARPLRGQHSASRSRSPSPARSSPAGQVAVAAGRARQLELQKGLTWTLASALAVPGEPLPTLPKEIELALTPLKLADLMEDRGDGAKLTVQQIRGIVRNKHSANVFRWLKRERIKALMQAGVTTEQSVTIASHHGASGALKWLADRNNMDRLTQGGKGFTTEQIVKIASHTGALKTLKTVLEKNWTDLLSKDEIVKLVSKNSGHQNLTRVLNNKNYLLADGQQRQRFLAEAISNRKGAKEAALAGTSDTVNAISRVSSANKRKSTTAAPEEEAPKRSRKE